MDGEANDAPSQSALQALAHRICEHIRGQWALSESEVFYRLHANRYIDITVIAPLFEGQMGPEREAKLWDVLFPFSRQELLYLAGCLLLTPNEAQQLGIQKPEDAEEKP